MCGTDLRFTHVLFICIICSGTIAPGLIAAQSRVPQQGTVPPSSQTAPTSDPSTVNRRLERIEDRLESVITAQEHRTQIAADQVTALYNAFQILAAVAGAVLVVFTIRDIVYRSKENQRQQTIDSIVKDVMSIQKASSQQQLQFGDIRLAQERGSIAQQTEAVQKVNDVIEVVRRTLDFRQQQEEQVAKTLMEIHELKAERARLRKQKLAQALAIQEQFRNVSRMDFPSLTPEQRQRGAKLRRIVDELEFGPSDTDYKVAGSSLYMAGVFAFYENDIAEAKGYFNRAADMHAQDHQGALATDQHYRLRFAFIHYYRALIQKNWGDLSEALHEIDQSVTLQDDRADEFLSPATRAEILFYIPGNEERCQREIQDVLHRLQEHERQKTKDGARLNSHQIRLRSRLLVFFGHVDFVRGHHSEALQHYSQAADANPNDYYALFATAQCRALLGLTDAASDSFRRCLDTIERSGDMHRKRERSTLAGIAATAAFAAQGCHDDVARRRYTAEAAELLEGNLSVDEMIPWFFSPTSKRLVRAHQLLEQVRQGSSETSAAEA